MIGYVRQAVILLAGCAFVLLMIAAFRRDKNATALPAAIPAELIETQAIGVAVGQHLAPHRTGWARRRSGSRRPAGARAQ